MKNLIFLFSIIFLISCQKELSVDKNSSISSNQNKNDILEERYSNSQIRQAIVNLISISNFNSLRDSLLINSLRETITLSELNYKGAAYADISILQSSNILFLYFPYIEQNYSAKTNINIISLDNVTATNQLADLNGSSVSVSQIENNLTVMYKTSSHSYDYLLDNHVSLSYLERAKAVTSGGGVTALAGGWLPWRRCYCEPRKFPEGGISSVGDCILYKGDATNGQKKCGRSGFISQDCPGNEC